MAVIFKREKGSSGAFGSQCIEERISVNLKVALTRYDAEGSLFTEQTTIEDVTSVGCRFRTQEEFQRGDIVSIKSLVPGQKCITEDHPQLFEVMWAAQQVNCWTVGARKLEGEKLANAKFPPPNHTPLNTPK
jgi:hypothetical protein